MEAIISKRHACRTIELKEMFHSLANSSVPERTRQKGSKLDFLRKSDEKMQFSEKNSQKICIYQKKAVPLHRLKLKIYEGDWESCRE